jgi:hypothetical protein
MVVVRSALGSLARHASPAAVALARTVLEQDVADAAWAEQIGPALSQRDVATLLNKSEQAVSKDPNLLRIRNRDGRPVYPVVQFEGRRQLTGVAGVVTSLRGVLEPLTIASWLTAPQRALDDVRPIDALREGQVAVVVRAARRLAGSAA